MFINFVINMGMAVILCVYISVRPAQRLIVVVVTASLEPRPALRTQHGRCCECQAERQLDIVVQFTTILWVQIHIKTFSPTIVWLSFPVRVLDTTSRQICYTAVLNCLKYFIPLVWLRTVYQQSQKLNGWTDHSCWSSACVKLNRFRLFW